MMISGRAIRSTDNSTRAQYRYQIPHPPVQMITVQINSNTTIINHQIEQISTPHTVQQQICAHGRVATRAERIELWRKEGRKEGKG